MATIYTTGGTVRPDSLGYIERKADSELFEALKAGEYCYVLDSRQKGKSSLMARCQLKLEAAGVRTVHLDLQRFGSNLDPERWYAGLLDALGEGLGVTGELFDYWGENLKFGPLQRFFGAVEAVLLKGAPLAIFIDEIDFVRSLPFSTDEFFAGIRECYNRRSSSPEFTKLTFCLLGVATPSELIRDVRITPFNIGKRIDLTDFTLQEALPLATGLGANGQALLARIHHWTGGHPYLTQKLCAVVADSNLDTPGAIDHLVESTFFGAKARQEEPNLSDVSRRLLESQPEGMSREAYLAQILDLYGKVRTGRRSVKDDETDPLVALLKLSGITAVVEGYLLVRNRIYYRVFDRQWLTANMPDAELQRQRAAARVAILKTSAVAALVVALVGRLALNSANLTQSARRLATQNANLAQARLTELAKANELATQNAHLAGVEAGERWAVQQEVQKAIKSTKEATDTAAKLKVALAVAETEKNAAASNERMAKGAEVTANARTAEAKAKAHEAYVLNLQAVAQALDEHKFGLANSTLRSMRSFPDRDCSYDYLNRFADSGYRVLVGHTKTTSAVRYTPDGKEVIASSYDGTMILWRVADGKPIRTIQGARAGISCEAISRDGREVFAGGADGSIACYDLGTGRTNWTVRSPSAIDWLTLSKSGKYLSACSQNGVLRVLQCVNGGVVTLSRLRASALSSAAFSPDDSTLAVASSAGDLILCGVPAFKVHDTIHSGLLNLQSVSYSTDGTEIAAAGIGKVKVWDVRSGQLTKSFPIDGDSQAVAASPGSKRWVSCDDTGKVAVWDDATSSKLYEFDEGETGVANDVVFSTDGNEIAACKGHNVLVMPLTVGASVRRIAKFKGPATEITVSDDGSRVAVGADSGTLQVLDGRTYRTLHTLQYHPNNMIFSDFSRDGKLLGVSSSTDDRAYVYELATMKQIASVQGGMGFDFSRTVARSSLEIATD